MSTPGRLHLATAVGSVENVKIRKVWPKEDADFTPWLREHIRELDRVLGLGLEDPRSEVAAGDFRIDLVASTDFGDVVIENQFGRSDHKHLGQLVTYLSHREVERAIWIVEEARPEHVKAVETLNERGIGQVWMVTVRTIRIGDSDPAPLFAVAVEPDVEKTIESSESTPSQIKKQKFWTALFNQARDDGIDSPFQNRTPSGHGMLSTPAKGQGLLYRVAVNRNESRVVLTNRKNRWLGALDALIEKRAEIDQAFEETNPKPLEWPEAASGGRWAIRYEVDVSYEGEPDPAKLRELNRAATAMKGIFAPYLEKLEEDSPETSDE